MCRGEWNRRGEGISRLSIAGPVDELLPTTRASRPKGGAPCAPAAGARARPIPVPIAGPDRDRDFSGWCSFSLLQLPQLLDILQVPRPSGLKLQFNQIIDRAEGCADLGRDF